MKKVLKVFVSSPGDVHDERTFAGNVFDRLNMEFADRLDIQPLFWEHQVRELYTDPQSQTPLTSEYDVVICILWTKLGSPLDPAKFQPCRSGTKFEIETALAEFEKSGRTRPRIYLFKRTSKKAIELGRDGNDKIEAEYKELEEYYRTLIGTDFLKRSENPYAGLREFTNLLEQAMREVIKDWLRDVPPPPHQLPSGEPKINPFQGLEFFDYEDSKYYFGRRLAIADVIEQLRAHDRHCAFVMIFGGSGLGKSSLVRAGVLPQLHLTHTFGPVELLRHVSLIPREARGGKQLFDLLAAALLHPGYPAGHKRRKLTASAPAEPLSAPSVASDPPPAGGPLVVTALPELAEIHTAESERLDAPRLAALLCENPAGAGGYIGQALNRLSSSLPPLDSTGKPPTSRLVIFIDQFEELFADPQREAFLASLGVLARCGWVWVLCTARSDFVAECEDWETLRNLMEQGGRKYLHPATKDELAEMIRLPATAAGIRFEDQTGSRHSGSRVAGRRLDDVIIHDAKGDPRILPLLEFTLDRLYQADHVSGEMKLETYELIGGVTGALAEHADKVFDDVFPLANASVIQPRLANASAPMTKDFALNLMQAMEQRHGKEAMKCFGRVMRQFVAIGTHEGSETLLGTGEAARQVIRATPYKAAFEGDPVQALFVNRLIEGRLLVAEGDEFTRQVFVSAAHETLLSGWPILAAYILVHRENLEARSRLSRDAAHWLELGRPPERLYADEHRLKEANRLLEEEFLDDQTQQEFVQASSAESAERWFATQLRQLSRRREVRELDRAGTVGEASRRKVLAAALADPAERTRRNAALFLGWQPPKADSPESKEIPALLVTLVDLIIKKEEDSVRKAAADSIVRLNRRELFDDLFSRKGSISRNTRVLSGIARVQIAAEASETTVDLSPWTTALGHWTRFRLWLRRRWVRFVRHISTFLLILIPQLILAAVVAGVAKVLTGKFTYAICQAEKSMVMGAFHGLVAAFFWGSFITFGISLYYYVFARRLGRVEPCDPVPLTAYFRPRGSLFFGAIAGLIGSMLITALIAGVFSSAALYKMGWLATERAKGTTEYFAEVRHDLLWETGFGWPYLFTGSALGVGMAMMANALRTSKRWSAVRDAQGKLDERKQVVNLAGKIIMTSARYSWPIPVMLVLGILAGFSVIDILFTPLPTRPATWSERFGVHSFNDEERKAELERNNELQRALKKAKLVQDAPPEKRAAVAQAPLTPEQKKAVDYQAESATTDADLRGWKLSSAGKLLGIAGDAFAQGTGGFFCIVGMGLGLIAIAKGINIDAEEE